MSAVSGWVELEAVAEPFVIGPTRLMFPFVGSGIFHGIPIDIENRRGSYREGVDRDGRPWRVRMRAHYGEIRATEGTDGDAIDVYVGPDHASKLVVVVDQTHPDTGAFDEQKVMLGFATEKKAVDLYKKQYNRPGFYGGHVTMTLDKFKEKIGRRAQSGEKIEKAARPRAVGSLIDVIQKDAGSRAKKLKTSGGGGGDKPPKGFTPIPGSQHGGWHKKGSKGWETWYPGHGVGPHPQEQLKPDEHEERRAAMRVEHRKFLDRLKDTFTRRYDPEKTSKPKKAKEDAPDWHEKTKHLELNKYPPKDAKNVKVHAKKGKDPHSGKVLSWETEGGAKGSAYTTEFDRNQAHSKWTRLATLVPQMAEGVSKLRAGMSEGSKKQRDAHAALSLIEHTGLRPGQLANARKAKPTYGVTTLRPEHVKFDGDRATISFVGKSSKQNHRIVDDPELVSALRERVDNPTPDGFLFSATDKDTSALMKQHFGRFKPKDLRTLQGSMKASEELSKLPPLSLTGDVAKDRKTVEAAIGQVSQKVAEHLGNEMPVARRSYVHPSLFTTWLEDQGAGHVVPKLFKSRLKVDLGDESHEHHPFAGLSPEAVDLLSRALQRAALLDHLTPESNEDEDDEDEAEDYPITHDGVDSGELDAVDELLPKKSKVKTKRRPARALYSGGAPVEKGGVEALSSWARGVLGA